MFNIKEWVDLYSNVDVISRIPLIFLRGEVLGGISDLKAALSSGDLEKMFIKAGVKRRKNAR